MVGAAPNPDATYTAIAPTPASSCNMSGIGECAIVYIPTIVATVRPAATPAEAPKSLRPSQYVRSTTPIAARRDGKTAVRTLTCPSDHEASAISHAASGGFTICGLPSGMAGTSQCPLVSASRADRKSTRLNSSHLVISYAVF